MTYAIYFGLAFILFLIQNWIGSRSYSKGYVRFSLLDEQDEAISFNYAVKVFGPLVYLILCVAILQYFQLNEYLSNLTETDLDQKDKDIDYSALRLHLVFPSTESR